MSLSWSFFFFFPSTVNLEMIFKILNSQLQASTCQDSHHDSQCVWASGFRWISVLAVLRQPDSHGSSVIFLFFKHISTLSSVAQNPASWAWFSIKHLQLDYIIYAPGSDGWWETDSLYRTHWSIRGHVMGIQSSGILPRERATRKLIQQQKGFVLVLNRKYHLFITIFNNWSYIIIERVYNNFFSKCSLYNFITSRTHMINTQ